MKAQFKPVGRIIFEIEGATTKDLFRQIAILDEVFSEPSCGICECPYHFVVRTVQANEFYELRCVNEKCRARLEFSQTKQGGGLFPRRKDPHGNRLPHDGWNIYTGGQPDAKQ